MKVVKEFEYQGYMCQEAQTFFEGKLTKEERDGCAVVGSFVELSNDKFKKCENGSISLIRWNFAIVSCKLYLVLYSFKKKNKTSKND